MIIVRTAVGVVATLLVIAVASPASAAPKGAAPAAEAVTQPAVVAQSNPVPGIGIIVKRNPGGTPPRRTVSGSDGSFSLQGLPPGSYEVTVSGQAPVAVMVGPDGQLKGVATTRGVVWSRVKNQNSM